MREIFCVMAALGVASGALAADEALTREQVRDVLKALHGGIRDFEFRYEGRYKRLRPPDTSKLPAGIREATERTARAGEDSSYRATVAYRDDFSAQLDLYDRSEIQGEPLRREVLALFRDKYSRRVIVPDRGGPAGPDRTEPGNLISFKMPKMAFWLTGHAYLDLYLTKGTSANYEFRGWETVDEHRCAVVGFYLAEPMTGGRYWEERFWVDLGRGGHPLKFEKLVEGNVAARVVDVKLARVEAEDGKPVWFPTSGRLLSYGTGLFEYAREPSAEQTFEVLQETLAINQGLKDARFTLDWGVSPKDRAIAKVSRRDAREGRPESPEARLARAEAGADSGEELEASAPSREGWMKRNAAAACVLLFGACAIVAAGYLKKR